MSGKVAAIAASAACLFAAPARAVDVPDLLYEHYRLDNGLGVILHQDHRTPVVFVAVWYSVGTGNERPGKSGFAHLFEHMMFQGSVNSGEDVYFEILQRTGASEVNATTNYDRTFYYQQVPSHQIEAALWLESDRMGYMLPLLTKESLSNQIDVVRNERRFRYENTPYGQSRLAVYQELFASGHPYRHTVIGRHEDLESATVKDVRDFFQSWYIPANATLAIAGDFDLDRTKALVGKWFGSFPDSFKPNVEPVTPTRVTETKRRTIHDAFAKLTRVEFAWHSPKKYGQGDAELEILASTLASRADTGRLYQRLVHQTQLARRVTVFQHGKAFSGTFHVTATAAPGAELGQIEAIIDEELSRIVAVPISDQELRRAVAMIESRFIWGLEHLISRVSALLEYDHFLGTPGYLARDLDRYRSATAQQVRAAARQYLNKHNRVEVVTQPAPEGE